MAGEGVHRANPSREVNADKSLTSIITLPGVERSVACARRFVRETLGSRHPALEKVAICVSELATNAIMHTPSGDGGQITVGLLVTGDTVRTEVTNEGTMTGKPRIRRDLGAESGRGILIIDALSEAWGFSEGSGTTTVWAEFRSASWTLPMPDLPRTGTPNGQSSPGGQDTA